MKELTYHRDYAARWVATFGCRTDESRRRLHDALTAIWPYVDELFQPTDQEVALSAVSVAVDLVPQKTATSLRRPTLITPRSARRMIVADDRRIRDRLPATRLNCNSPTFSDRSDPQKPPGSPGTASNGTNALETAACYSSKSIGGLNAAPGLIVFSLCVESAVFMAGPPQQIRRLCGCRSGAGPCRPTGTRRQVRRCPPQR